MPWQPALGFKHRASVRNTNARPQHGARTHMRTDATARKPREL